MLTNQKVYDFVYNFVNDNMENDNTSIKVNDEVIEFKHIEDLLIYT